jgi:hypothetical protein
VRKVFQTGYLGWYLGRFECTCAEGRGALVAGLVGFGGGICQIWQVLLKRWWVLLRLAAKAMKPRVPVVSKAKLEGSGLVAVAVFWDLSSGMRIWVRR